MGKKKSDRRRLVETLMAAKGMGELAPWIASHREAGTTWADMSYELRDAIGFSVSYEALRRWSVDDAVEEGETGAAQAE